jgi:hypothetical protein
VRGLVRFAKNGADMTAVAVQLDAYIGDPALAFNELVFRHCCGDRVKLAGHKALDAVVERDPTDARFSLPYRQFE